MIYLLFDALVWMGPVMSDSTLWYMPSTAIGCIVTGSSSLPNLAAGCNRSLHVLLFVLVAPAPIVILHNVGRLVNAIMTVSVSFGSDVRSVLNIRDSFV